MAGGGMINEPIFGVGLRSGSSYEFGEGGESEAVIPSSKLGGEGSGTVNHFHINAMDAKSFNDFLSKNSPAVTNALQRESNKGSAALRGLIGKNV
jgi:hypothetical protein